jgi:hypothetical protein
LTSELSLQQVFETLALANEARRAVLDENFRG